MSDWGDDWEEWVDQPLPRYGKEIPIVGRNWLLEVDDTATPETDYQALMEAEPYAEPRVSQDHLDRSNNRYNLDDPDLLAAQLADLSEEEQAVIDCMIIAGHSVRKTAEILGWPKSTVHRIKTSALERLRHRMETE